MQFLGAVSPKSCYSKLLCELCHEQKLSSAYHDMPGHVDTKELVLQV